MLLTYLIHLILNPNLKNLLKEEEKLILSKFLKEGLS